MLLFFYTVQNDLTTTKSQRLLYLYRVDERSLKTIEWKNTLHIIDPTAYCERRESSEGTYLPEKEKINIHYIRYK